MLFLKHGFPFARWLQGNKLPSLPALPCADECTDFSPVLLEVKLLSGSLAEMGALCVRPVRGIVVLVVCLLISVSLHLPISLQRVSKCSGTYTKKLRCHSRNTVIVPISSCLRFLYNCSDIELVARQLKDLVQICMNQMNIKCVFSIPPISWLKVNKQKVLLLVKLFVKLT